MTAVPQTNPKAGYLAYQAAIDDCVRRVLHSGWYILGSEGRAFEQEFASYLGAAHARGVANGTDAIELCLRACGVGPGDLVATVSHTAVATVTAVEAAGATPLLVDIDPKSFVLDAERLEHALKKAGGRVRAVVVVHLYGHAADIKRIAAICEQHSAVLIEDCAQSHGALVDGKRLGTWGKAAAFSFYPTKNLGALGDGGAMATNDAGIAERVTQLREYGWRERYLSEICGTNSRLDEMQAAILRVKLAHLDEDNAHRRRIAAAYDVGLAGSHVTPPATHASHVYHQYVLRTPKRAELAAHLKARNIGTLVHYPFPVHLQPAYLGRIAIAEGGLPNTEQAAREVLSLPMYPQLDDDSVQHVIEGVRSWSGR